MREVKFRGQKFSGEWVYGSYHYCNQPGKLGKIKYSGGVEYKDVEFNSHWILVHSTPDTVGWSERDTYSAHSVNPETVGQYIGVKDKSGRYIYEGDTLRGIKKEQQDKEGISAYAINDTVSWDFGGFNVFGRNIQSGYTRDFNVLYQFMWVVKSIHLMPDTYYQIDEIEIIGNIHENPELLTPSTNK